MHAIAWCCTPRVSAAPSAPSSMGWSEYVSCERPHAGWRGRLMHTPPKKLPPCSRISAPIARPTRSSSSTSHVAPRAMETGNAVERPTTHPRGPSTNRIPGMPSRSTAPIT
ncbi:Uncharacterised protein [Mycobacteroides abscessus]|nr:Uncharacterised protein [Mycobacteroides abscessus]